jgi:hypothetical protein
MASMLNGRRRRAALESLPKLVNVFDQEFPAAIQERDREKEGASWINGAYISGHNLRLGSEGGMRFAFPPYGVLRIIIFIKSFASR